MAHRRILLVALAVLATAAVAVASSSFADSNPIRPVTERAASAAESTVLAALGRTRHALRFARFAVRYGKSYENAAEVQRRFRIFTESLEEVRSTNQKGLSYKLGINRFSDMSWEEFQATRLGAAQTCSATLAGNHLMRDANALPDTKDWRETGIVSPVKNQKSCGSCWTFSTTGALEAAYTQATGKNISLSEQQLVDCAGGFNNLDAAEAFHPRHLSTSNTMVALTARSLTLTTVSMVSAITSVKMLQFRFWTQSTSHCFCFFFCGGKNAEDELKNAVGLVRPVSVAFQVIKGFKQYAGGVYTSDHCGTTPKDVNHAVLAVGYGVENGAPYWLIKNSWGADWGENGYFKMALGKNMCAVATCASYPILAA